MDAMLFSGRCTLHTNMAWHSTNIPTMVTVNTVWLAAKHRRRASRL